MKTRLRFCRPIAVSKSSRERFATTGGNDSLNRLGCPPSGLFGGRCESLHMQRLFSREFAACRRETTWRSPRTNTSYPVSMSVSVRTGALTWQLDPLMDDQELDSRQSTGAVYWEGAVRVSRDGADLGRAYLELTGYANALRIGRQ